MTSEVHGAVAPEFAGVAEVFAATAATGSGRGAALSIRVDGQAVLDVTLGERSPGQPWTSDTATNIFSAGKVFTSASVGHLVAQGAVALDDLVGSHWPEFACNGKENVSLRQLMAHQAGLPATDPPFTLDAMEDWHAACSALAAQQPFWQPGAAFGYHSLMWGILVGEIVRRVSGLMPSEYFAQHIGAAECWVRAPGASDQPVAETVSDPPPTARRQIPDTAPPAFLSAVGTHYALLLPDLLAGRDRTIELPAVGWATSRGLADFYAGLLAGTVIDRRTVADLRRRQTSGADIYTGWDVAWGAGLMLASPYVPLSGRDSFGHVGANASLGFAEPERGIAFAYVANTLQPQLPGQPGRDPRTSAVIAELKRALG